MSNTNGPFCQVVCANVCLNIQSLLHSTYIISGTAESYNRDRALDECLLPILQDNHLRVNSGGLTVSTMGALEGGSHVNVFSHTLL